MRFQLLVLIFDTCNGNATATYSINLPDVGACRSVANSLYNRYVNQTDLNVDIISSAVDIKTGSVVHL